MESAGEELPPVELLPPILADVIALLSITGAYVLRSVSHILASVLILAATLIFIGQVYPLVARSLGIPETSVYSLVTSTDQSVSAALQGPTPTPLPTSTPLPTPTPVPPGVGGVITSPNTPLEISLRSITFYDDASKHPGAFSVGFAFLNLSNQQLLLAIDWNQWHAVDSTGTKYNWVRATKLPSSQCGMSIPLVPPAGMIGASGPASTQTTTTVPPHKTVTTTVDFGKCGDAHQRITAGAQLVKIWIDHLGKLTNPTFEVPIENQTAPTFTPEPSARSESTPTAAPIPASTSLYVANTNGDGVCVRSSPKRVPGELGGKNCIKAWADGTVLDSLGQTTTSGGEDWLKVKDPEGNIGWVPYQYAVHSSTER